MSLLSIWILKVTSKADNFTYTDSIHSEYENAALKIHVICKDEGYINLTKKSDFCYIAVDEDNYTVTFKIEERIVKQ